MSFWVMVSIRNPVNSKKKMMKRKRHPVMMKKIMLFIILPFGVVAQADMVSYAPPPG
jgi:hypothetical protein